MSGHLTLGSPWKSSRHPAGALPVFEGVPGDDPPPAEADGRNDALLQHRVDREPPEDTDLADMVAFYNAGTGFQGSDEYQPPGAENSLIATGLPDACLTDDFNDELGVPPTPQDVPVWRPEQQSCISTATASLRQAEHMRLSTVAARTGFLVLRLRSYPAWRIAINGRLVTNLPARDDGLIAVPVREGPVDLAVDWTTTPDVIAGRWVSGLALVALIGLALLERKLCRARTR